jgi:hypothetical protein
MVDQLPIFESTYGKKRIIGKQIFDLVSELALISLTISQISVISPQGQDLHSWKA